MRSESCVTITSSVMPSRVGRLAGFLFVSMLAFYRESLRHEPLQNRFRFSMASRRTDFLAACLLEKGYQQQSI
jgi:hypothetical protein